jgi:hypothetical protein
MTAIEIRFYFWEQIKIRSEESGELGTYGSTEIHLFARNSRTDSAVCAGKLV